MNMPLLAAVAAPLPNGSAIWIKQRNPGLNLKFMFEDVPTPQAAVAAPTPQAAGAAPIYEINISGMYDWQVLLSKMQPMFPQCNPKRFRAYKADDETWAKLGMGRDSLLSRDLRANDTVLLKYWLPGAAPTIQTPLPGLQQELVTLNTGIYSDIPVTQVTIGAAAAAPSPTCTCASSSVGSRSSRARR